MLIIKEGLTDMNALVRESCINFLKQTILAHLDDLSHLFLIIDCRKIFVKEYYMQLPFLILSLIFHVVEDEMLLTEYLARIIKKLKT